MGEPALRFSFKVYRRPFRVPVRTSYGQWSARLGVLLRTEDETGKTRFGEIAPIDRFNTESLAAALAWCGTIGEITDPGRLRAVPRGHACCAAAIAALLALPEIADRNQHLTVACLLPTGAGAIDAVERARDAGYTTFKLKIGAADAATEMADVARLVERLPKEGMMRLDANGAFDIRAAMRWLDAAANWPVEFIEQPLAPEADEDLARLARDHATPVALDESVLGADDIKRWRDRGWSGVFVIKPALAGATAELLPEVRLTPGQFVFSSALETMIGAAAGIRLAFAAGVTRALGYGVAAFFPDDGLGGGVSGSAITVGEVEGWNLEAAWNQL